MIIKLGKKPFELSWRHVLCGRWRENLSIVDASVTWSKRETWVENFRFFEFPNCKLRNRNEVSTLLTFFFFRRNSSCPHEVGRIQDAPPRVFFSGVKKSCCIFPERCEVLIIFFRLLQSDGLFSKPASSPMNFCLKNRLGWQICWMGILDPFLVA